MAELETRTTQTRVLRCVGSIPTSDTYEYGKTKNIFQKNGESVFRNNLESLIRSVRLAARMQACHACGAGSIPARTAEKRIFYSQVAEW